MTEKLDIPHTTVSEIESKQQKRSKGISRRDFLKRAPLVALSSLAALDSALSHLPEAGLGWFTKKFWQRLETQTFNVSSKELKELIENKFQVKVLNPPLSPYEQNVINSTPWEAVTWNSPYLKLLYYVLGELPFHFYAPHHKKGPLYKKDEERIKVVEFIAVKSKKGKSTGIHSMCHCGGPDFIRHSIIPIEIDTRAFYPSLLFFKRACGLIAHELTHRLDLLSPVTYIESIITRPFNIEPTNDYSDSGKSVLTKFLKRVDTDVLEKGLDMDDWKHRNLLQSQQIPREFFPVAVEFYTRGEKEFHELFGMIYPQGDVAILYEGIRREFFKGKEY